jgi:hypothetical protein
MKKNNLGGGKAMHEGLEVSVSTIRERLFLERLRLVHPDRAEAFPKMKVKERTKFVEDNWSKLFPGPDPALLRVVNGPVQKLVMKGMDAEADEVVRSHLEPQIKAKMHNTTELYIIMLRYAYNVKDHNAEEQSRLLLNYYLLLVEGVYTAQVNLLAYLLTNSGAAYHSSKSVSEHGQQNGSLGTIEEDSLWNKLRFLEENGFGFMVEACDRQLRNSVAHLDFIVFTNGCVGYGANQKNSRIMKYEELVHKVEALKSISDAMDRSTIESVQAWREQAKRPRAKPVSKKTVEKDPEEILRRAEVKPVKVRKESAEGDVRL